MSAGMAVLVDGVLGGQEPLGLPGRLEPLHAEPPSLADRARELTEATATFLVNQRTWSGRSAPRREHCVRRIGKR